jgi:hypothetical protein
MSEFQPLSSAMMRSLKQVRQSLVARARAGRVGSLLVGRLLTCGTSTGGQSHLRRNSGV